MNCEFCKKEYANQSSLKLHQKTAKFCLEIQQRLNNIKSENKENKDEKEENKFICEFCDKSFNLKSHLKTHIVNCKVKKDKIDKSHLDELNNLKVELVRKNEYINKLESELKIEINSKNEYTSKLESKIACKNEYIDKLEKELEEYKKNVFENNKILSSKETTVYNNCNNNNEYNIEFNKMVQNLVPCTKENIASRINNIHCDSIIYPNDFNVKYNISSTIAHQLKDTAFVTDFSRGIICTKDENGISHKSNSEKYILDCMDLTKSELLRLCQKTLNTLREREDELVYEDYSNCMTTLGFVIDMINGKRQNKLITKIGNMLCDVSPKLSKK